MYAPCYMLYADEGQSNLVIGNVAAYRGFWPRNLPLLSGIGGLCKGVTWTTEMSLPNCIFFHPVALAGCASVTDDIHVHKMDRPHYANICRNRWYCFQRCRL